MGRVWDFLNQDAEKALDPIVAPYVRFALGHRLIMWLAVAMQVVLIWVLFSKTVALLFAGVWAGLFVVLLARVLWILWRRRRLAKPS